MSETFRINPHPEKHAGLDVVFFDNGDVGMATAELASLLRLKAGSWQGDFSLAG